MTTFFFNTMGNPIAFRRNGDDKFLFDKNGNWIGWFPWGDSDAVDKEGNYLGTTVGNRLLKRISQPYRGYPGYPGTLAIPDTRGTKQGSRTSRSQA